MPQKISGYLKQFPVLLSIGISVLIFFIVWGLPGIYYEEYESFFTALLSGALTPGMIYDSLYHMSHLGGLAYVYSHLAAVMPSVPVINLIEYLMLIFSLSVLLYIYIVSSQKISWWTIFLISVLSIEYFEMLNCSRVSVLACIASGGLLIYILKNEKSFFTREGILFFILWIFGLFTRVETALFSLSIIAPLFFLILYSEYQFKVKIRYYAAIIFCILSVGLMTLFIAFRSTISDEFYLQIDPKYEAEIMFKQNVVPISNMQNKTDSIRYKAIVKGFWGDAKLNDIHFLESLVNNNKTGFFYLKSAAEYQNLLKLFFNRYYLYIIPYLILCTFFLFGKKFHSRRFLAGLAFYQISVLLITILLAIQVKFADRVTVSLLTGSIMLQILTITMYQKDRDNNFLSNLFFVLFPVLAIVYHCLLLARFHSREILQNKIDIESNNALQAAKTLILSSESTEKILNTYRPFETFSLLRQKNIFLLDNLAFCTIQPYKSYLQKTLQCRPDDYSELFIAVEKYDSEALYLWAPERISFLRYYLKEIHQSDIISLSKQR